MSKKKKTEQVEQVKQAEAMIAHDEPCKEPVLAQEEGKTAEPVYLRETLFALPEIKSFGLNQFFLRAILKEKYYTLSEAQRIIRSVL